MLFGTGNTKKPFATLLFKSREDIHRNLQMVKACGNIQNTKIFRVSNIISRAHNQMVHTWS
jgi:hypothetical protein